MILLFFLLAWLHCSVEKQLLVRLDVVIPLEPLPTFGVRVVFFVVVAVSFRPPAHIISGLYVIVVVAVIVIVVVFAALVKVVFVFLAAAVVVILILEQKQLRFGGIRETTSS